VEVARSSSREVHTIQSFSLQIVTLPALKNLLRNYFQTPPVLKMVRVGTMEMLSEILFNQLGLVFLELPEDLALLHSSRK
jgi:hypothetical protein